MVLDTSGSMERHVLAKALGAIASYAEAKDGPMLIITDGQCDPLRVPREHAYLLPAGRRLPFRTTAPIFVMG